MDFFREVKRRNVHRMAGLYLVGAWLVVQIAATIFPAFGFADLAVRIVVIVLAIGFVPALVFSWIFELTPQGLKRRHCRSGARSSVGGRVAGASISTPDVGCWLALGCLRSKVRARANARRRSGK
jgi:hypothetical protein